ncbi:MAG: signal peptidase II [Acidimicrobiales bacterium]
MNPAGSGRAVAREENGPDVLSAFNGCRGGTSGEGSGASLGDRGRRRYQRKGGLLLTVTASAVVALDQWSKDRAQAYLQRFPCRCRHVVGPLSLQLTANRGAAFGLGASAYPIVVAAAVALVVVLVAYSRRAAMGGVSWSVAIGLGLLSGGAVSNLADRFVRHHHGAVVDFIRVVSWWPVFNVADAAITTGAVVLGASLLLSSPKSTKDVPGTSARPMSSGPAAPGL